MAARTFMTYGISLPMIQLRRAYISLLCCSGMLWGKWLVWYWWL